MAADWNANTPTSGENSSMPRQKVKLSRLAAGLLPVFALCAETPVQAAPRQIVPGRLRAVGKVDPLYQSYNVEMVEVIGGRFWAPYPKPGEQSPAPGTDPGSIMFRKREPLDLKNDRRLRNLARALGPAYVRVSGAWANSTYFHDSDAPPPAKPPTGYQGVLTRAQWAGVVDFVRATGSKLVVSFPVSAGARDANGVWNPDQARRLVNYTRKLGGSIYAAELINEPNVGPLVALPEKYDATSFAKDIAAFRQFAAKEAPGMKIVGPGSTGEAGFMMFPLHPGALKTEQMMSAEPRPVFDIFSYHFYGTVSKRCSAMDKSTGIAPDQALGEAWLSRADTVFDYYKALQNRFAPGKPIWVTEIAEASCGGDAWAATWLDTFRYVDQLGRLARRGAAALFHNTLSASDYALIDDTTHDPRPSYWAALLWRKLMGDVVLDAGDNHGDLHVYSHCLRGRRGGVAIVAINLDRTGSASLAVTKPGIRYTLTADQLQASNVRLNGRQLAVGAKDVVPQLIGAPIRPGTTALPPASITYLASPDANNKSCR
jgi:heparanase 1